MLDMVFSSAVLLALLSTTQGEETYKSGTFRNTEIKPLVVGYVSRGTRCRAKAGDKENENKGRYIEGIYPERTKYKDKLDTYNCYDEHTRWKKAGKEILLHGMTVSVTWKALERHEGEFDYGLIDEALARAAEENKKRTDAEGPVRVRLRVFTGWVAPHWLKSKEGVGIFEDEYGNRYPRYWEPKFAKAYKKMMEALGDRYDDKPEGKLLSEVAISMCGLEGAETLNIPAGGKKLHNMVFAGYTEEKHKKCLNKQLEIHNKFWRHTTTMVSVKVWEKTVVTGDVKRKYVPGVSNIIQEHTPAFTDIYIANCERILGDRCRIGNTSVGLEDCVLDLGNANKDLWFNSLTRVKNTPRNGKHSIWAQSWVSTKKTDKMPIPEDTPSKSCGDVTSLDQYLNDTPDWTAHFHSSAEYVGDNGFVSYELPSDWQKVFDTTTNNDDASNTKFNILKSAQEKMISNAKSQESAGLLI